MKIRRGLDEAARHCGIEPDLIVRYIHFEWIAPVDREQRILDEEDVARVRLILQLQRDLGVNDEAVPIILHLIDQLNRTHLEFYREDERKTVLK
jgi:chaperone modulatory protein CbpM